MPLEAADAGAIAGHDVVISGTYAAGVARQISARARSVSIARGAISSDSSDHVHVGYARTAGLYVRQAAFEERTLRRARCEPGCAGVRVGGVVGAGESP